MSTVTRQGTTEDVPSWLDFLPEVEDLFGPMPGFEVHVRRGIARGTAVVAADGVDLAGAALLSRNGEPHRIHWLAVRHSQRRKGIGTALLSAILGRWPNGDLEVVTFTADEPGGEPARRLYERFGFVCLGRTEQAPDGGQRDLYLLQR